MPARSQHVIDFDDEPGLFGTMLRPVLSRPLDSLASAVAVAAALAIILNALAFQDGPHPAPIFGLNAPAPQATHAASRQLPPAPLPRPSSPATTSAITPPASVAPQASVAAESSREDLVRAVQAELARLNRYDGDVDGIFGPKTDFAIRDFERATGRAPSGEPTQQILEVLKSTKTPAAQATATPAPAAPSGTTPSKRILAIQQVLAEQGYGPIKLDGVLGEATKTAIFRFEIHRNLPPTGEISARFIRELSAVSGVPLE